MVRTQVQLTEEQLRAVKQLAQREGRSVAGIVRESLDAHLRARRLGDRDELKRRSLASLGAFRSNLGDLATNHDRYLADELGEAPAGEGRR